MTQRIRHATQIAFIVFFIVIGVWPTLLPGGDHLFRWDFITVGTAAISTRVVIGSLLFSALLVFTTLLFGRVFCGWSCPLGTLADFLDYIFHFETRGEKYKTIKYHILLFCLVLAVFGVSTAWVLDPLTWSTRILGIFSPGYVDYLWFSILTGVFVGIHFVFGRRAFCRILCPLGAGLGMLAKFSFLKRELDTKTCTNCDLCVINNRSFAIGKTPDIYNSAECFQCRECETICPEKSLSFNYVRRFSGNGPARKSASLIPVVELGNSPVKTFDPSRRSFLVNVVPHSATLTVGVLTGLALKDNNAHAGNNPDIMRPPGAVIEDDFINRCIRCNACFRACPTETLVPSGFSRSLLAYGTPILDPAAGGCLYECNACGEACPTGAIAAIPLLEKQKLKMGTSKVNTNTCIPYQTGKPCTSCAAACPYTAISWVTKNKELPWGDDLLYPVVDAEKCTGCGLCESACPVDGVAAINVTAEYPRQDVKLSQFDERHKPVNYFNIYPES